MWTTLIVQPFTNVLLMITMLVKNFGIAIILFTLLIKLITYPLTAAQIKSTQKMTELTNSPKYKKIQQKYKDNKEMLAQEQFRLQREAGVNPFGSCLPTLIQLPIIFGLYQSIMKAMASTPMEMVNLKRIIYPFLDPNKILPIQNRFLWMDLGQPERLMVFGIGIPVLAILVVLTQFILAKVMEPPSTGENEQAAAMSQSMSTTMPLLTGWMAYSLASGLALYFLANNIATTIQYSAQGRTDWSKVFPFLKTKNDPQAVKTYEPEPDDDEYEEEEPVVVETPKAARPSARAAVKMRRLKRRKK